MKERKDPAEGDWDIKKNRRGNEREIWWAPIRRSISAARCLQLSQARLGNRPGGAAAVAAAGAGRGDLEARGRRRGGRVPGFLRRPAGASSASLLQHGYALADGGSGNVAAVARSGANGEIAGLM